MSKMKNIYTELEEDEPDMVNHPPHYTAHPKGIECIDVIEDNPFYNLAAAMKYLWRVSWGSKFDDLEDLEKAAWYVQREITHRRNMQAPEPATPLFPPFMPEATAVENDFTCCSHGEEWFEVPLPEFGPGFGALKRGKLVDQDESPERQGYPWD